MPPARVLDRVRKHEPATAIPATAHRAKRAEDVADIKDVRVAARKKDSLLATSLPLH